MNSPKTWIARACAFGRRGASLAVLVILSIPLSAIGQSISVGSSAGEPGWIIPIDVNLTTSGQSVAAFQHELYVDPLKTPIASTADGDPDCVSAPGSSKGANFAFHPVGCDPGECHTVRAVVIDEEATSPMSDGIAYTCNFEISSDAVAGNTYVILVGELHAAGPAGTSVPESCGQCGCP